MKKVIKIIIIMLFISICLYNCTYAMSLKDLTGNGAKVNAIQETGNSIVKVVSTIGSIISVIVLIVLGIKYMMGSVEEKAEYKKTLMPYTIGAILVFAASTIAGIIYNVAIQI